MCGVFAYAGTRPPTRSQLDDAVRLAARRGPHGHGWATEEGVHRQLGVLDDPGRVPAARWVIGHSRLATYGMPRDESGLQPVTVNGHVLVHNGNVTNWQDLDPTAATDSWALGAVYADNRALGMHPRQALSTTLAACHTKAGAIVIRDASGPLVAWRRRLPLHALYTSAGVFLSSGPIPGSHLLPEERALTIKEAT